MASASPEPNEERERKYCGAKKRQGEGTCRLPAGHGTDHVGYGHCKRHLGSTKNHRAHAAKLEIRDSLGGVPITADGALEEALAIANGLVQALKAKVAQLAEDEVITAAGCHVLTRELGKAAKDLAHVGGVVVNTGLVERHVAARELEVELLSSALGGIFGELEHRLAAALGLDIERIRAALRDEAPPIVRRHLQLLEGGAQAA